MKKTALIITIILSLFVVSCDNNVETHSRASLHHLSFRTAYAVRNLILLSQP